MSSRHRRRKKGSQGLPGGEKKTSPLQKPQIEQVICPVCNAPIQEIYLSLVDATSGNTVHFDCAVQLIREREPLREGETLVYIGSGTFAISDRVPGTGPFNIRKKILFEEKESAAPWRRRIAFSL
ncbi:MAG: hypothetical protein N2442_04105 [Spirochaetes bacterium]|nr:hypothetical protein [Spirochaetota bacterium]